MTGATTPAAKLNQIPDNSTTLLRPSSKFPSHLDAPSGTLDPRVHALCEILNNVPDADIEVALSQSGISALTEVVESVICHSYSNPTAAVRFFQWAALSYPHSSAAWNLMVDLLGKNQLFEAMWDAIRSMRQEPLKPLTVKTFVSVFGSYCSVGKIKEAVMTFDVMDRYGIEKDVFAVNSLLSAICRMEGLVSDASEFFDKIKLKIPPDLDSFAIMLEGWEKEGNVARAKTMFGEMVVRLGWDPRNVPAYDAFLSTLIKGGQTDEAIKFLQVMKNKGCFPGMKFFANALDILFNKNDVPNAIMLWDTMVNSGNIMPNTIMYNAMITLYCMRFDFASVWLLLDEMPLQGAFPDLVTYNIIFEFLVKSKMVREAAKFFAEMKKNEFVPSPTNCVTAVRMFFDQYDPETALDVWALVLEENLTLREECANEVLVGLRNLGRMMEASMYAEGMLDMGITLHPTTMEKLKDGFKKSGRSHMYDRIKKRLSSQTDR